MRRKVKTFMVYVVAFIIVILVAVIAYAILDNLESLK